ncbi:MAG: hypothetical protein IIX61_05515, partial [Loktanella sp.]|nr:hypothetical protein [Loktanella sp.]
MILKERLFLANCDSVRQLSQEEVAKRLLLGAAFAKGVVMSVNLLIDNHGMADVLSRPDLEAWYREEGAGSLSLRGMFSGDQLSLVDYFKDLPPAYRMSRLGGRKKAEMTALETDQILRDLDRLDHLLGLYGASTTPVVRSPDALAKAVAKRIKRNPGAAELLFAAGIDPGTLVSRSDYYAALGHAVLPVADKERLRVGIVDAAYNSLFVQRGEAFAMDRIPVLGGLPTAFLSGTVNLRSYRREIGHLRTGARVFSFISSLATEEILRVLT